MIESNGYYSLRAFQNAVDQFFFKLVDIRMLGIIRILFSGLLLIDISILWPDLLTFFGEDGIMPYATSRAIIDPDTMSVFAFFPTSSTFIFIIYGLLIFHLVLLALGLFSRLQALFVLIYFTSFVHRNIILFDGEDTVFRLFAFYLILAPSGYAYSLDNWIRRRRGIIVPTLYPVWPLRLFQLQMCLIYVSTCWEKLDGIDWIEGTALYYVMRLEDFSRGTMPAFFGNSQWLWQPASWGVLVLEASLPIFLWFNQTRLWLVALGILFHMGIDFSMNLLLFQWIMITGLLSFVDIRDLKNPLKP